ncbi:hypothetical protein ES705_31254 [subsurface metagenome]
MQKENTTAITLGFYALLAVIVYLVYMNRQDNIISPVSQPQVISPGNTIVKTQEVRPKLPHIINHNIKANVWKEIKFPQDIAGWQMVCRDNFDVYYCFEPSASTFKTLKAGTVLSEDTSPNKSIYAVYVRCANDTIIEIELWRS